MAETKSQPSTYSSLIRLRCLQHYELPSLPSGGETATQEQEQARPSLESFIAQALEDGHAFISSYMPKEFKVQRKDQTSPPSAAKVELVAKDIKAQDLPAELSRKPDQGNETWFARTSVHENAAKAGTGSWEEFDSGLRVNHSQNEKDYTPGVAATNKVYNWREKLAERDGKIAGWEDVTMEVREMKHSIPAPLNDRVFTVVVITAKRSQEFLVVQIPLFAKGLPNLKLSGQAGVTAGRYVSIEHGELVNGGAEVRWRMATASDAQGRLPMFIQKMGVPGAVIKDVGLFVDWCDKNRKK